MIEAAALIRKLQTRVRRLETLEHAGVVGGYTLIEEKSPTGGTSITFSSIPSTFRHLEVWFIVQQDGAGASVAMSMRINANSTAGDYHLTGHISLKSTGGPADVHTLFGGSQDAFGSFVQVPGSASALSDENAFGFVRIPYYAQTAFGKGVITSSGFFFPSGRDNIEGKFVHGRVKELAAISSIEFFFPGAQIFETGSLFSLYGIG